MARMSDRGAYGTCAQQGSRSAVASPADARQALKRQQIFPWQSDFSRNWSRVAQGSGYARAPSGASMLP